MLLLQGMLGGLERADQAHRGEPEVRRQVWTGVKLCEEMWEEI